MKGKKILFIDDDISIQKLIAMHLNKAGYNVTTEGDGRKAEEIIHNEVFDLIVCDLKLGEISGMDILRMVKGLSLPSGVIIITGHGSIENAVEAIRIGADDYITKPVDPDELTIRIEQVLEKHRLKIENINLREQLDKKFGLDNIIAASSGMQKVLEMVKRIAASNATVLIEGESGTGKEVIAKAIHNNSPRQGPFIAINCGAMPEQLLESELFGHMRGAFTGANTTKKGLFEEACNGTIFLDEIGDTTLTFQIKLLRVLQESEIRRVGDTKDIPINVRVLAASNRPLRQLVYNRQFRQDLYYRLRVIPLYIPPLRKRREDIIPLANFFIKRYCERNGRVLVRIGKDARKKIEKFSWPGNVRELENTIERAMILTQGDVLSADDIFLEDTLNQSLSDSFVPTSLKEVEKEHIKKVLDHCFWNQTEAAKILGIGYNTLWRKIKEYDIKK